MSRIFSQFQADYTIVRIGIITMFLVTIAFSIIILPNPRSWTTIWFWKLQAHQCSRILYNNLCVFGGADMFCLHIIQLGLDQMPDASSSSITSFIAWIIFSISTGTWVGEFGNYEGQLFRANN